MVSWQSGRMHYLGKVANEQSFHRFESYTHRRILFSHKNMDNKKTKLQESIRNSLAKQGSDFLVPFVSSIISILTSHELSGLEVKKSLKKLKIKNITTKDDQIESQTRVIDFKVYILYAGVKNYIFKIEGLEHYEGFSFMETNKGMIVHDNVTDDPKPLAKDLKNLFIKNYKSPYPVTDVFLDFINKKSNNN